jgi:DNA invertase Pin-like site-specific DNA recombinase
LKPVKTKERPELEKMRGQLRSGDTVVVWKLDRLGRSLRDLIILVADFKNRGVGVATFAWREKDRQI